MTQRPRLSTGPVLRHRQNVRQYIYIYHRPHAVLRLNKPTVRQNTEDYPSNVARPSHDPIKAPLPQPLIIPKVIAPKKRIMAPKWMLFGVPATLVVLLASCFFIFGARNGRTVQPAQVKEATHTPKRGAVSARNLAGPRVNRGLPDQLEIPKIQVSAPISYLGVKADGRMAAPNDIVHAGWYKYGPLPGNAGSAVIVGHLDGLKGQPGVFGSLGKLSPGDMVSVVDDKHQTTSFVVRAVQTYGQNDKPEDLFSSSGFHLNLVTCTGNWDPVHHTYLQRLVVFTDKV